MRYAAARLAAKISAWASVLLLVYWLIHSRLPERLDIWRLFPFWADAGALTVVVVFAVLAKYSNDHNLFPGASLADAAREAKIKRAYRVILDNKEPLVRADVPCLLCESQLLGLQCTFHPGTIVTAWAGSATNPYREVYYWTCCGEAVVERDAPESEGRPDRYLGCAQRADHVRAASVALVYTQDYASQLDRIAESLAQRGIRSEALAVDEYVAAAPSVDAVIVLVGSAGEGQAVRLSERTIGAQHDVPFVVYCDADLPEWRIQVAPTGAISERALYEAACQAIRRAYFPRRGWRPDVFISYTRKSAAVVASYVGRMRRSYWLDTAVLAPGVRWANEIFAGIEKSYAFFLIVTPETPDPTFCWMELQAALDQKKPIFVVCHGDTESKLFKATSTRPEDWRERSVTVRYDTTMRIRVADVRGVNVTLFDAIPETASEKDRIDMASSIVDVLEARR